MVGIERHTILASKGCMSPMPQELSLDGGFNCIELFAQSIR